MYMTLIGRTGCKLRHPRPLNDQKQWNITAVIRKEDWFTRKKTRSPTIARCQMPRVQFQIAQKIQKTLQNKPGLISI
jgi:hypothetical protein